jgi:hypothetical protein
VRLVASGKDVVVSGYEIKALTSGTLDAFADLCARHNGAGMGGCWCTWFHRETHSAPRSSAVPRTADYSRDFKRRLVETGRADNAGLSGSSPRRAAKGFTLQWRRPTLRACRASGTHSRHAASGIVVAVVAALLAWWISAKYGERRVGEPPVPNAISPPPKICTAHTVSCSLFGRRGSSIPRRPSTLQPCTLIAIF